MKSTNPCRHAHVLQIRPFKPCNPHRHQVAKPCHPWRRHHQVVAMSLPTVPPHNHRGRVEHLLVQETAPILQVLVNRLGLSPETSTELLFLGAVYACHVPPKTLSSEAIDDARRAAIKIHGPSPKLSVPTRVLDPTAIMPQHGYIRAHVSPKRSSIAASTPWALRIIANAEHYIVINKPPGVKSGSTVDNVRESAAACVARCIQFHQPELLLLARLDSCTEGVLVLGKTREFARYYQALLAQPALEYKQGLASSSLSQKRHVMQKTYRALSLHPPPRGTQAGYCTTCNTIQGLSQFTLFAQHAFLPNALYCELDVVETKRVALSPAALDLCDHVVQEGYESTILLKTGRTHQIRAQMAALGCVLLGDSMYGPLSKMDFGDLVRDITTWKGKGGLVNDEVMERGGDYDTDTDANANGSIKARLCALHPDPWWGMDKRETRGMCEPWERVGLQAARLDIHLSTKQDADFWQVEGDAVSFCVKDSPWWRS